MGRVIDRVIDYYGEFTACKWTSGDTGTLSRKLPPIRELQRLRPLSWEKLRTRMDAE
jgi:hypothetical protein